jgi:predicted nucleotidyltransferase
MITHNRTANGLEGRGTELHTLATRYGWRLIVLFGSTVRGERGRDLDLAVLPETMPSLLEQGHWLAELEALASPQPVDLLVLHDAISPVLRFEVFREGVCVFESSPGLFAQEQDRAFFLYADSETFRRRLRAGLHDIPTN